MDFYHTCTDLSLGEEIELVRFWGPCLYFQGHRRSKIVEKYIVGVNPVRISVPLLVCKIFLEAVCGISPNFHGYINKTSLRTD